MSVQNNKGVFSHQEGYQRFNIAYDLGMNEQAVCSYLPNNFKRNVKPHLFNKNTEKEIKQILATFDSDDKKNKPRNNNNNNNNNNDNKGQNNSNNQQNKKTVKILVKA